MQYDTLVFIGRFAPFHNGHKRVVDRALEISQRVIILLGSSNRSRSVRNPWTFEERKSMIESVYPNSNRVVLKPLNDNMYMDTEWVQDVQSVVNSVLDEFPGNSPNMTLHGLNDMKIGLIGCDKDQTSYYLKLFPNWGNEKVTYLNPINATDIRQQFFFSKDWTETVARHVPQSIVDYLTSFEETKAFATIRDEYAFVQAYKQQWVGAPYPPTFNTVDAVVVQSGHLLVVRRGARPGLGQLALPGGFIGENETFKDAVLRELREETRLKVPMPVLAGSIIKTERFDDPHRSSRGRTITEAFLLRLNDQTTLPKVKGGDDAAAAFWMPLAEVKARSKDFFEDHWFIIQKMIGGL